jgi:hypothetical protein
MTVSGGEVVHSSVDDLIDGEKAPLVQPSPGKDCEVFVEDSVEIEGTHMLSAAAKTSQPKPKVWCLIMSVFVMVGVGILKVLRTSDHGSIPQVSFGLSLESAATIDDLLGALGDDEWLPDKDVLDAGAIEKLLDFTPSDIADLGMQFNDQEETSKGRRLSVNVAGGEDATSCSCDNGVCCCTPAEGNAMCSGMPATMKTGGQGVTPEEVKKSKDKVECPNDSTDVNNINTAKSTILCAAGKKITDTKMISNAFKALHQYAKADPEHMCGLITPLQKLISMNWSKASTSLMLGLILHGGSVKCIADEFKELLVKHNLIEHIAKTIKTGSPLASAFQKTKEALIVLLLAQSQGAATLLILLANAKIAEPFFKVLTHDVTDEDAKEGGIACAEIGLGYSFILKAHEESGSHTVVWTATGSMSDVLCGDSVQAFIEAAADAAKRLKCKKQDWPGWSAVADYMKCSS